MFLIQKSIAEALIIQTSMSILNDYGYEDIFVDINSLGDNRSFSTFLRDIHYYYKKILILFVLAVRIGTKKIYLKYSVVKVKNVLS